MSPGPLPEDAKTLAFKGSWRSQKREPAATVPSSAPKKPAWIAKDRVASACWDRTVKALLAGTRLLCAADADLIGLYCNTWSRWRAAEDVLDREGMTYESAKARGGGSMHRPRPEVAVAAESARLLLKLEGELGMTPLARKRLGVSAAKPEADGPKYARTVGKLKTPERGPFSRKR